MVCSWCYILCNIFLNQRQRLHKNIPCVKGDCISIHETYTRNTQTQNNGLWIIQGVVPRGVETNNAQRYRERRDDRLSYSILFSIHMLLPTKRLKPVRVPSINSLDKIHCLSLNIQLTSLNLLFIFTATQWTETTEMARQDTPTVS